MYMEKKDHSKENIGRREFLKRFRELGGEIVTVGSDAHTKERVGQYTDEALAILAEILE